jgi:hypothetical protein
VTNRPLPQQRESIGRRMERSRKPCEKPSAVPRRSVSTYSTLPSLGSTPPLGNASPVRERQEGDVGESWSGAEQVV